MSWLRRKAAFPDLDPEARGQREEEVENEALYNKLNSYGHLDVYYVHAYESESNGQFYFKEGFIKGIASPKKWENWPYHAQLGDSENYFEVFQQLKNGKTAISEDADGCGMVGFSTKREGLAKKVKDAFYGAMPPGYAENSMR